MEWEKLAPELSVVTDSKIILLVIDGLGGLPIQGKTELEAAHTPNLDNLAAKSACGVTDPVFMGITPGSGPAHLALFGYNPLKYILGRGILEALGVGVEVGKNDLVARGNFATSRNDLIVDRRAGRIPDSENKKLCQKLNSSLKRRTGIKVFLYPGKEHRFVVKFSGKGLSDALSDADPQKDHKPRVPTQPLSEEAAETAQIVNDFLDEAIDILKGSSKANTLLLRGFSKHPALSTMHELFKLNPAAIANYPMYKGLARLVGMKIVDPGPTLPELFEATEKNYDKYDFFYIHIKKTDAAGEDGDFEAKKEAIEETDSYIPRLLALKPEVLAVTSDHSTPSLLKSHSWHPNPFLLFSKTALPDNVAHLSEKECSQGFLGRFQAIYAMPLLLAHAGKLKKYGA
ncbi:MAG: 2,3-bisphosphoglycerate-independent phosphoglycerate mutase [Candidatus Aminicenantes bacterium]|nr:MAG: 2,3-bisphosphoglycerate-independent phosphoglycerate mutase [Candidatus Aminicenantes bacterium]